MTKPEIKTFEVNRRNYDQYNEERLTFKSDIGLSEEVVRMISKDKGEPEWMLKKRLKALEYFNELSTPTWGPSLDKLDLLKIHYYIKSDAIKNARSWDDVPKDIRETYERLGIPKGPSEKANPEKGQSW